MKISIIKGNEKIPLLTRVTKPRTECCAQKNATDAVFKKVVFVKVLSGFQSFPKGGGGGGGGGHDRSVKHYFPGNIPHQ